MQLSTVLRRSPFLMFMVGTSFFGLFLTVMLALNSPMGSENFLWRRPLIGFLFGLVCIFGISAVFFPKHCSAAFSFRKKAKRSRLDMGMFTSHRATSIMGGHHPDCEKFSAHVFRTNNRRLCAACTGLLLGGLFSLVGAWLYFFNGWGFGGSSLHVVFFGIVGVSLGLLQFKVRRSIVRMIVNSLFVFGALLLLVGIDELAQSVLADLFVIALTLFWLFTRISLSQWNNWRICYTCDVDSCEFHNSDKKGVELLSAA